MLTQPNNQLNYAHVNAPSIIIVKLTDGVTTWYYGTANLPALGVINKITNFGGIESSFDELDCTFSVGNISVSIDNTANISGVRPSDELSDIVGHNADIYITNDPNVTSLTQCYHVVSGTVEEPISCNYEKVDIFIYNKGERYNKELPDKLLTDVFSAVPEENKDKHAGIIYGNFSRNFDDAWSTSNGLAKAYRVSNYRNFCFCAHPFIGSGSMYSPAGDPVPLFSYAWLYLDMGQQYPSRVTASYGQRKPLKNNYYYFLDQNCVYSDDNKVIYQCQQSYFLNNIPDVTDRLVHTVTYPTTKYKTDINGCAYDNKTTTRVDIYPNNYLNNDDFTQTGIYLWGIENGTDLFNALKNSQDWQLQLVYKNINIYYMDYLYKDANRKGNLRDITLSTWLHYFAGSSVNIYSSIIENNSNKLNLGMVGVHREWKATNVGVLRQCLTPSNLLINNQSISSGSVDRAGNAITNYRTSTMLANKISEGILNVGLLLGIKVCRVQYNLNWNGGGSPSGKDKILGTVEDMYLNLVTNETETKPGDTTSHLEGRVSIKGRPYGSWITDFNLTNWGEFKVGNLIEDPAMIIASLLIDECGLTTADLDIPSFKNAVTTLPFRLNITDDNKGNVFDIIADLCKETNFIFCFTPAGKAKLITLRNLAGSQGEGGQVVKATIPLNRIVDGIRGIDLAYSGTGKIVNQLTVKSRPIPGKDTYIDNNVYNNTVSQTKYGIRKAEVEFKSVNNSVSGAFVNKWKGVWNPSFLWENPAATIANHLVHHKSTSGTANDGFLSREFPIVTFKTVNTLYCYLEIGDVIQLDYTVLDNLFKLYGASWQNSYLQIQSMNIQEDSVEFTCRLCPQYSMYYQVKVA
jgi:hypothetical protein